MLVGQLVQMLSFAWVRQTQLVDEEIGGSSTPRTISIPMSILSFHPGLDD